MWKILLSSYGVCCTVVAPVEQELCIACGPCPLCLLSHRRSSTHLIRISAWDTYIYTYPVYICISSYILCWKVWERWYFVDTVLLNFGYAQFQDCLLQCLQLCVSKFFESQRRMEEGREGEDQPVEGSDETPEVLEEGKAILDSLVERMIKSEPEDFELVCLYIYVCSHIVYLRTCT